MATHISIDGIVIPVLLLALAGVIKFAAVQYQQWCDGRMKRARDYERVRAELEHEELRKEVIANNPSAPQNQPQPLR